MSSTVRKLLIILSIILAVILIAGTIYVRFWLDPSLKEKLIALTAESSKGMYALELDRVHFNVLTGSAVADGIHLTTDSIRWDSIKQLRPDDTPTYIDLNIRRMRIKNIRWIGFLQTKDLSLRKIQVFDPQIKLVSIRDTAQAKVPQLNTITKSMLERLPVLIAPHAKSIHIGSLSISNGKMSVRNLQGGASSFQQADSIGGVLLNLDIVANDTMETRRALYSDNITLTLHNYEWYPAGSVYGYRIKAATLGGSDEVLKLDEVSILPNITDAEFMQRQKVRVPRLKIRVGEILVRKFDLYRALHKREWTMESVNVEKARFNVYQNKNLPLSMNKRMPNEIFRNIKPYFNVDTVFIRNSHILYTELMEDDKGQLEFENTNGVILNLSNDTSKMSISTPARIDARAELMGAGLLDLSLQIPLLSSSFRCDLTANLGKIDMTYLNRLVEDKNNLRVESGNAQKILAKIQVRNGLAQGTLEATYDDLKISILREKDGGKKKLVSAVANLILRGKNERGDEGDKPFKVGTVYYQREPGDGILRYVWRAAQTGLMSTLIPSNIKVKPQDDGKGNAQKKGKDEKKEKKEQDKKEKEKKEKDEKKEEQKKENGEKND